MSVYDIAGKVVDEDAVLDGVVDAAELVFNVILCDARVSPVGFDGVVGI